MGNREKTRTLTNVSIVCCGISAIETGMNGIDGICVGDLSTGEIGIGSLVIGGVVVTGE